MKMYLGAVSDFEINAPAMHQIILYYPTNKCEHMYSIYIIFRYNSIYLHERNMNYTFLADWEGTWIMYQIQRQAALENTGAMTSTNLQIRKKTSYRVNLWVHTIRYPDNESAERLLGVCIFCDFVKSAYLIRGRKLPTLLTLYKEGHCSLGYKLLNRDTSKSSCMKEEKECISTWISTSGKRSRYAMERTHGMIMSKECHLA